LAIDCTYKITTNELPLVVFGTSDLHRHFRPIGVCLISTDESAETFKTLFRGIQVNYFEREWLLKLPFWYEGAAMLTPSTNNGLESKNGKIKQNYTMRQKMPISAFLQTAEHLKAFEWLQEIDKSQIAQLNPFTFVVPSNDPKINVFARVQQLNSADWQSFDEFIRWSSSGHLLNCSRFLPPWFCSCRYGLKEHSCMYAIGLMMMWGTRPVPQLIGKRREIGRPKKIKLALQYDQKTELVVF
ncbi:unnamed protein product, partial [Didymodactylos carnosus]